jgi:acyl carrier protein
VADTTAASDSAEPAPGFVSVLRAHLPALDPGQRPEPAETLASYGLDSLGSITLMLALEDELLLTFPEDRLTPETFHTVGSLWRTVVDIQQSQR